MTPRDRAFAHFKKADPKLFGAIRDANTFPETLGKKLTPQKLFEELCWTIVGQQLSGKAADTIFGRFKKLCGRVTPNAVSEKSLEDFRSVGISGAKGRAIHDLAAHVLDGRLTLSKLKTLPEGEVMDALLDVKGIGPWTAEMVMMFSLGREDVFSLGDLGLKKGAQKVYGLRALPTPKKMRALSDSWEPYRTWAALILWRSLDGAK